MSNQKENIVGMCKKIDAQAEHTRKLEQRIHDLRASLAKYEDAEGRPVVVGKFSDLAEDLRVNADAHPLDVRLQVMSEAADVLESQSREIERLKARISTRNINLANATSELAALKVQPSGVVLPEPMKRGDEGGSGEYGAAMIRGYNACLREVARLNSSPVSAGGVDDVMVDRAMNARMPGGSTAWVWLFNCEGGCQPEEKHRDWFRTVLAAALKDRSALSAPSHGEQVREVVQVSAVGQVAYVGDGELGIEWLLEGGICELIPGQLLLVSDSPITDDEGYGEVYAAAPSAVSQEQGE
jgi:hypothetical protein